MPKVSVIIPVYNVESYLRQCLDSVINQTLQDIEIICIDDGSEDNSLSILKEYALKDNRIKVLKQENQGSGIARNKALDIAQGEYIMFLDPDDWLDLCACELAYKQACTNNNEFVLFTYYKYYDNNKTIKKTTKRIKPFKQILEEPNINLSEVQTNTLVNCNIWVQIYKKSFLDDNKIRFPNLRCTQDLPFVVECWLKSSNISILNKPLYYYRVRNTSMTFSTKNYLDRFKARKIAFDKVNKSNNVNVRNAYYVHYICSLKYWFKQISYSHILLKSEYYNEMRNIYTLLKNKYYNDFLTQYINYDFFEFVCKHNFYTMILKDLMTFLQNLFSITNTIQKDNSKHKVITILGIKLKFKIKNKENNEAE